METVPPSNRDRRRRAPFDRPSPGQSVEPTDDTQPTDDARPTDDAEPSRPAPSRPERTPVRDETEKPEKPARTDGGSETLEPSPPASVEAGATVTSETPVDEPDSTPAWVWWLPAGIAVAVLAGAAGLWARTRGRKSWRAELEAAEAEVVWFAHVLLPELRRATSLDQVRGGWDVASPRVEAAQDRLTVLEASAPDDDEGARARSLRDAVRRASQRLDSLTVVGLHDTWALDLDDVQAELARALDPVATTSGAEEV